MTKRLALYIILFLCPAIYAVIGVGLFPYWILGAITVPILIQLLLFKTTLSRRIFVFILAFLASTGSIFLTISLYLQAAGFNDQFFYHMEWESLILGLKEYMAFIIIGVLYIALCTIYPIWLKRKPVGAKLNRKILTPALFMVSAFCFAPLVSITSYSYDSYRNNVMAEGRLMQGPAQLDIQPLTQTPKNLILIYAESLEQTYFDESIFPGLLPNLTELKKSAVVFSNTRQVSGTGWTIAGIVSTQCSIPFNIKHFDGEEAHAGLAAIEKPFPNEICLADILKGYGYDTSFMGGAKLSFAGKGKFLRGHGFDKALGFEELKTRMADPSYRSGWGIHDDELFRMASENLGALRQQDKPFLMNILTVDTHHPGAHSAPSCKPYDDGSEETLNAMYCTDQLISKFIKEQMALNDMDNTIIAVVSDHLSMRNSVWDTLSENQPKRRLTFMLWGGGYEPQTLSQYATHFDVGPTLMDVIGLPNYKEHNFGSTLKNGEQGLWYSQNESEKQAAKNISYLGDSKANISNGIRIDRVSKQLFVGDQSFEISRAGLPIYQTFFTLLLKDNGDVDAVVFANTMKDFNRITEGKPVIAISYNDELVGEAQLIAATKTGERRQADIQKAEGALGDGAQPAKPLEPYYYLIGYPDGDTALTGYVFEQTSLSKRETKSKVPPLIFYAMAQI